MISIPNQFVERIKLQFPENWTEILDSLNTEPRTSIRLNSRKKTELNFQLNEKIDWISSGYFIDKRPNFTLDPFIHAGVYYVQEASSMFIDYVYKSLAKEYNFEKHLDLCAAPGGKSSLILDNLNSNQFLISNEVLPKRNIILRENLTKWGNPNILVTENKAQDFSRLKKYFDFILIDAPCSGEGMFRKDEQARIEWSPKNVTKCSIRQTSILENIWDSLADGGVMIYSTCTFASEENEILLDKFQKSGFEFECLDLDISIEWGINTVKYNNIIGYQFLPNKVKGEGFFCSILKKKGSLTSRKNINSTSHINPWLRQFIDKKYLENYSTYKFKNSLFLAPNLLLDDLVYLQKYLYVKQIGIEVGNYKSENIEVNHGLAMLDCEINFQNIINLNLEQAIAYLKLNSFSFEISDGKYLINYNQIKLGFGIIKNNQLESQYPVSWKIKRN